MTHQQNWFVACTVLYTRTNFREWCIVSRTPVHATNIFIWNGSPPPCKFCTIKTHNFITFACILVAWIRVITTWVYVPQRLLFWGSSKEHKWDVPSVGFTLGKKCSLVTTSAFLTAKHGGDGIQMYKKRYVLGEAFKLNMTTHAIRSMRKYGGLDNYLTKQPQRKLEDSNVAIVLRQRILAKQRAIKAEGK